LFVKPADGETYVYELNDTHFNARGNAVVGRALADFLKRWPEDIGGVGGSPSH
jgi:hypothetical protein